MSSSNKSSLPRSSSGSPRWAPAFEEELRVAVPGIRLEEPEQQHRAIRVQGPPSALPILGSRGGGRKSVFFFYTRSPSAFKQPWATPPQSGWALAWRKLVARPLPLT